MCGDTHAPGGQICRVPVAELRGAYIHPQYVLARVGSAPSYPAEILEVVAKLGVRMSQYLTG